MPAIAYPHGLLTTNSNENSKANSAVAADLIQVIVNYLRRVAHPDAVAIAPERNGVWSFDCRLYGYQFRVTLQRFAEDASKWVIACRIGGSLLNALRLRLSRRNRNDSLIRLAVAIHDSFQTALVVTSITWYWGRPDLAGETGYPSPRQLPVAKG